MSSLFQRIDFTGAANGLSNVAGGIGGSIALADPRKAQTVNGGVVVTQNFLGGIGAVGSSLQNPTLRPNAPAGTTTTPLTIGTKTIPNIDPNQFATGLQGIATGIGGSIALADPRKTQGAQIGVGVTN